MQAEIAQEARLRVDELDHQIREQAEQAHKVYRKSTGRDRCIWWQLTPGDMTRYELIVAFHHDPQDKPYRGVVTLMNLVRHPIATELPGYVVDNRSAWSARDALHGFQHSDGTVNEYTAEIIARFVSYFTHFTRVGG